MSQTHESPDRESTPSMPRWAKVFGIIALVVVLLFVVVLLTGGEHGPGRHLPSADATGETPTARITGDSTPSDNDANDHTPLAHGG